MITDYVVYYNIFIFFYTPPPHRYMKRCADTHVSIGDMVLLEPGPPSKYVIYCAIIYIYIHIDV